MSILIKMEMPKNCGECPCYYDGYCHGLQYREEDEDYRAVSYKEYDKKRRADCPLIEVPKHGDLIDRSMMLNTVSNRMFEFPKGHEEEYDFWARVYDFIVNAPIVIEADDSIKEVEWETHNDGIMYWWECSRCNHEAWYDKDYLPNYCPYCGAKMKNEE